MDEASNVQHCGFSRGRDAEKLERIALTGKRKITFNTYNIADFKFLIGTRHVDDEALECESLTCL